MHAHLPAEETPLFGMLAVTEVSFPGQYSDVPAVPSAVVRVHSRGDKYGGKAPKVFLGAWERLEILLVAIVGRDEKWLFIDQALCLLL